MGSRRLVRSSQGERDASSEDSVLDPVRRRSQRLLTHPGTSFYSATGTSGLPTMSARTRLLCMRMGQPSVLPGSGWGEGSSTTSQLLSDGPDEAHREESDHVPSSLQGSSPRSKQQVEVGTSQSGAEESPSESSQASISNRRGPVLSSRRSSHLSVNRLSSGEESLSESSQTSRGSSVLRRSSRLSVNRPSNGEESLSESSQTSRGSSVLRRSSRLKGFVDSSADEAHPECAEVPSTRSGCMPTSRQSSRRLSVGYVGSDDLKSDEEQVAVKRSTRRKSCYPSFNLSNVEEVAVESDQAPQALVSEKQGDQIEAVLSCSRSKTENQPAQRRLKLHVMSMKGPVRPNLEHIEEDLKEQDSPPSPLPLPPSLRSSTGLQLSSAEGSASEAITVPPTPSSKTTSSISFAYHHTKLGGTMLGSGDGSLGLQPSSTFNTESLEDRYLGPGRSEGSDAASVVAYISPKTGRLVQGGDDHLSLTNETNPADSLKGRLGDSQLLFVTGEAMTDRNLAPQYGFTTPDMVEGGTLAPVGNSSTPLGHTQEKPSQFQACVVPTAACPATGAALLATTSTRKRLLPLAVVEALAGSRFGKHRPSHIPLPKDPTLHDDGESSGSDSNADGESGSDADDVGARDRAAAGAKAQSRMAPRYAAKVLETKMTAVRAMPKSAKTFMHNALYRHVRRTPAVNYARPGQKH